VIVQEVRPTTRIRDFYDIHIICQQEDVDEDILRKAFQATSKKRGTIGMIGQLSVILENIELNGMMQRDWENYKRNSFFCW
jgi:uncharacterized OsmC-like protein